MNDELCENKQIKLVIFDMDGTITKSHNRLNLWQALNNFITDPKLKEEANSFERNYKQDISGCKDYGEFSRRMVEIYSHAGFTKKKLDEIGEKILQISEGAKEAIDELRDAGLKTAVISGGWKNVYRFISDKYGINVDIALCAIDVNYDDKGNITGCETYNYNYEGKIEAIELLSDSLKVKYAEMAVIGNGRNDIAMFKKVGVSIAFNSEYEEVDTAATYIVRGNMRKIVPLLT